MAGTSQASGPQSRPGQSHPPPTCPPIGGPANSTHSRTARTGPPQEAQLGRTASPQASSTCASVDNTPPPERQEDELRHSYTVSDAMFAVAEALETVLAKYQMPDDTQVALKTVIRTAGKIGIREGKRDIIQVTLEDVRTLCKDLLTDFTAKQNALEDKVACIVSSQEQILMATDRIAKEAMGINAATKNLECKVTKVTDAADQFTDTTRTYKDALFTKSGQPLESMMDLKIKDDLERKAKQILFNIRSNDLDGVSITEVSITEIKDQANKAIVEVEDYLERPGKVEVDFVTVMRNRAVLLQLNTKDAAEWLKMPVSKSNSPRSSLRTPLSLTGTTTSLFQECQLRSTQRMLSTSVK